MLPSGLTAALAGAILLAVASSPSVAQVRGFGRPLDPLRFLR